MTHMFDSDDEEKNTLDTGGYSSNERQTAPIFVEKIVPVYGDYEFKNHFRLSRGTLQSVLEIITPKLEEQAGRPGRPTIPSMKQVLCALRTLTTQDSHRSIADRFGLSKSAVGGCLNRFCAILNAEAPNFIRMPQESEMMEIASKFEAFSGFPGVIGAIDSTHIPIKEPREDSEKYMNRKGFHTIILQAVCKEDMQFIDCFCGYPGSIHDAKVFRNSDVGQDLLRNIVPNSFHLIGDSAYPLLTSLIVPFKDNGHLSEREQNFNNKLSKTRIVIEKAFHILKQRFRRLKNFDFQKTENIPNYVLACCILHNICIINNDLFEENQKDICSMQPPDEYLIQESSQLAKEKREHLSSLLL